MSFTQVTLIQDVPNLGVAGEVVKVKLGYARNFLLPQKLAAIPGSAEAKAVLKNIKQRKDEKSEQKEIKQEKKAEQAQKREVMKAKKAKLLKK